MDLHANGAGFDLRGNLDGSPRTRSVSDHVRLVKRADVVHVHGWGHQLGRIVCGVARKAGKPYIISPHGALCSAAQRQRGFRDKLRTLWSENRLLRGAAALTSLNEAEQHELNICRPKSDIVQLPYGVSVSEYENIRKGDVQAEAARGSQTVDGRFVLMLCPVHPAEGFVPLLKALAELGPDADDWSVVVAGREVGDWRKMLEAAIRRKGGERRVVFAAAPDTAAQKDWLARASIVAVPSLQVRFAVSIMQAMVAGVPVLASQYVAPPGTQDVIRICAPTRGDLKLGLRSLLGMSDAERVDLGRRAREIGRTLFDWTTIAEQYARLYRRLV